MQKRKRKNQLYSTMQKRRRKNQLYSTMQKKVKKINYNQLCKKEKEKNQLHGIFLIGSAPKRVEDGKIPTK